MSEDSYRNSYHHHHHYGDSVGISKRTIRPKNSNSSQAKEGQNKDYKDSFHLKYKVLDKIGEGSYSEVLKCRQRDSGNLVACKRLKHSYKNWHQVNDIAEIATMRALPKHINILQMIETHFDQPLGKVSLVFEIMDLNLYELIKDRKTLLADSRVRMLMFQLMRAIRHLHKHGIFHRDIKPENILLKSKTDLLKLGDLGSVRGLYSRPPYTEYISTRWYRSPECLLTAGYYSFKMDIWAAACVFYETMTLRPLFPGSSEIDQINKINGVMGPPPTRVLQKFFKQFHSEKDKYRNRTQQARWDLIHSTLSELSATYIESGASKGNTFDWYFNGGDDEIGLDEHLPDSIPSDAKDLMISMLSYDPDARPTAHRVLCHPYFREAGLSDAPRDKDKIPTVTLLVELGDEKTKDAIMNMEIDLKTIGDKKVKRQKQQKYALIQKQTEEKVRAAQSMEPKHSTLIQERGSSPCTPEHERQQRRSIITAVIPDSARVTTLEVLKKKTLQQPKKVQRSTEEQRNAALEIARKRLSIRRRDIEEVVERKSIEPQGFTGKPQGITGKPQGLAGKPQALAGKPQALTGKPQALAGKPQGFTGKPRETLLKNKIDAMLKTKNSILQNALDSKQGSSSSTMGSFTGYTRPKLANINGAPKNEGIGKKLMATVKHSSNLHQTYLGRVVDKKDINRNPMMNSVSSSKSSLPKDKVISTLKAPPALPRYETMAKPKLPPLRNEESRVRPRVGDQMVTSMFPRNRLPPNTHRSSSSTRSSVQQQPLTKFSQVQPVRVPEKKPQALTKSIVPRGGGSLPSKIDHLSRYPAHQSPKPPLPPPKRVRNPEDFDNYNEERPIFEPKHLGDASPHMSFIKMNNESTAPNVPSKAHLDRVSEAMRRRAARNPGNTGMRDDVYCSSDEDVLSSMRRKFDELISQRVQRCYLRNNRDTDDEDDDVNGNNAKIPIDPMKERAERILRYTNRYI